MARLLTEPEVTARFDAGTVDRTTARTVASWFYSPGAPAMVAFVTADQLDDASALLSEVDAELGSAGYDDDARIELRHLRTWITDTYEL
jgi:hypothetical protein